MSRVLLARTVKCFVNPGKKAGIVGGDRMRLEISGFEGYKEMIDY